MRLIDADAPRKTFVDWLNWYKGSEAVRSIVREAVDILDETPTVDAEPVRHASLKETGYDEAWCNWGDCTKCGTSNIFGSKYCNECGAKLDGGKQDD